jgi:hypothetical protein
MAEEDYQEDIVKFVVPVERMRGRIWEFAQADRICHSRREYTCGRQQSLWLEGPRRGVESCKCNEGRAHEEDKGTQNEDKSLSWTCCHKA